MGRPAADGLAARSPFRRCNEGDRVTTIPLHLSVAFDASRGRRLDVWRALRCRTSIA